MMIKIYCNAHLQKVLKRNNVNHYSPAYNGESVGLDLYNSGEDVIINSMNNSAIKKNLIATGLHIHVPKDYVAIIAERGSIIKTFLKVRAGVIDPGYTDEVFVSLINMSAYSTIIKKGEKLPVQIIVVKCLNVFETITEIENNALSQSYKRKEGKIGSSN
jgi:dUTPase